MIELNISDVVVLVLVLASTAILMNGVGQAGEMQGAATTIMRKLDGPESDCPFSQLFSYKKLNSCMVASGEEANSHVRLGHDCTSICPVDADGLMRVEGTQLCLQASHGAVVKDGSKMRLYPCDKNNELQQFTWIDDSDPHPLRLKSRKYSDFCVTNRGIRALDGDPIIIKACDNLKPVERQFWWGD